MNFIYDFFDGLEDAIKMGFDQLIEILDQSDEYNAEFRKASELISKSNKGWSIDGRRFTDMDTARRNLLIVANSGLGKSQTHVLPTILNATSSMLVNDVATELVSTIPYLQSKNVDTHILNLLEKGEVYINVLDGLLGDVAGIRRVSKSIIGKPSGGENNFFNMYAEDCLSLFIQQVLEAEPKVHANLGNVYRLILEYQANPEVVERYMAETASPDVWRKFLALSKNSEKTLKSIIATCLSELSWLGENPVLCDITSCTTISYKQFRQQQTALFIQSPPNDTFYAKMIALIFQSFYRFAFSYLPDPNKELDILMIQDEFSSLIPGLPDYSQIISNSRKFLIPQAVILQDISQLSPFGQLKDNIISNCYVKCFYGGIDSKKALEIERMLGSYTYTCKKTKHTKKRPLIYASEIQQLDGEILVLSSNKKPIRTKITPAYKQPKLQKYLQMESPVAEHPPVEYGIQYIDLDPYREPTNIGNDEL